MTFEEFTAERMPGVLRFAAVLAGDRATAADLAQEVLIRAYSRWDRIGCLDRPERYVRKMMLNEFLCGQPPEARTEPVSLPWVPRISQMIVRPPKVQAPEFG